VVTSIHGNPGSNNHEEIHIDHGPRLGTNALSFSGVGALLLINALFIGLPSGMAYRRYGPAIEKTLW